MHLYHLSLQASGAVDALVIGNFCSTKRQEIAIARVGRLELLTVDSKTGSLVTLFSQETFGVIRSLASFRLIGSSKDHLVLGTDAGRLIVLSYDPKRQAFTKVCQETFGKTGCRRIVPGQYVACDPRGRALMVASVEKSKFVYVLNRDAAANLTISSPLEAHKANMIILAVAGMDVGYENPNFAVLEIDHASYEEQQTSSDPLSLSSIHHPTTLAFYELDLGLNHMLRKSSRPVDPMAHHLVAIPGGTDGPGGVLVCSDDSIAWHHPDFELIRARLPRRPASMFDETGQDPAYHSTCIVSSVVHRIKKMFFVLLQNELGDLFKVSMVTTSSSDPTCPVTVDLLSVTYFDTIPSSSVGMVLFKSGFLFAASDFGNHYLYQVESLGEGEGNYDDSKEAEEPAELSNGLTRIPGDSTVSNDLSPVLKFTPHPLRHLTVVHELESLNPLVCSALLCNPKRGYGSTSFKLLAGVGQGSRSSLRILNPGLHTMELAVSQLPDHAAGIWSVPANSHSKVSAYMVITFSDSTLVLSVGEEVEEATDTGFNCSVRTLAATQVGDRDFLQVYARGVRHVTAEGRVREWSAPGHKAVLKAACNNHQVVVVLSGAELIYFELDDSGQLHEHREHKSLPDDVSCLDMGELVQGRRRNPFLVVGGMDKTIRVLSLDPDKCLETLSLQAVSSHVESVCLISDESPGGGFYLYVGLQNGLLIRASIDAVTGQITDSRTRLLGTQPLRLSRIQSSGTAAVLALTNTPYICLAGSGGENIVHPLSYETLEYGCGFSSPQLPDGICALKGDTLHIVSADRASSSPFHTASVPLRFTPRRLLDLPHLSNHVLVCESDHRHTNTASSGAISRSHDDALSAMQFGYPQTRDGTWAACLHVVNHAEARIVAESLLSDNEAVVSACTVVFAREDDEEAAAGPAPTYVCVGTAHSYHPCSRTHEGGSILVFTSMPDAPLTLLHRTRIDEPARAMSEFQGQLLIGAGTTLRTYALGKRQLLRKSETLGIGTHIVGLQVMGNRLLISDIQRSIMLAVFHDLGSVFRVVADEAQCRFVTAAIFLDDDTVAAADKFGNVVVLRLDPRVSEEYGSDRSGTRLLHQKPHLLGAPHKLELVSSFYMGDTITQLSKAVLSVGAKECLLCSGLRGGLNVLIPLSSKHDVTFLQTLEGHLREEWPMLSGREHRSYRSYYQPVKQVIDGDLIELFTLLPMDRQRALASQLEHTVAEIAKKVESYRLAALM
ncbi:hypothetical protein CXG81DRAFT_15495 [Caulochytrium protostelioides]|uniref:DNA damage-binding protein 1 n=1 Tax=Caulochytrium protostelioides TaxID=1555241 RepID=A0A4P9X2M9_9FUNG|nr:hypothetical protein CAUPRSCDRAFT_5495 [Caulochytrium protostelioides]RKO98746.1 hypothetical protein CXG81DRAFT_15495 [Caulochytrium protostelioides]|eukprot:RKO98746.1 hypothetical protein CXG81DRAFT_15495 [Caulochytrium protostelioides]